MTTEALVEENGVPSTENAEPNPAENAAAPNVEEKPVTSAEIEAARSAGDIDALRKIQDRLMNKPAPAEKKEESAPAPAADSQQAQSDQDDPNAQAKTPKVWTVNYGGRTLSEKDDDQYLGYGKQSVLKRNHVILKEQLKEALDDVGMARELIKNSKSEIKKYQDKIAELEKLAKDRHVPQFTPSAKPNNEPANQAGKEIVAPTFPEGLASDRSLWSADDWETFNKYEAQREEYIIQKASTAASSVAPAKNEELETMRSKLEQLIAEREQEKLESKKAQEAEEKRRKSDSVWKLFDEFQDEIPDFKTPKRLRDLDQDIRLWSERLAKASKLSLRADASDEEYKAYEERKQGLIEGYLKGDQNVLKAAEGTDPPEGLKKYFDLSDLFSQRNAYIQKGRLGENAGLIDAYYLSLRENGKIDLGVQKVEQDALNRGVQSTLKAVGDVTSNYARTLPSNASAQASTNLEKEEIRAIVQKASTSQGLQEILANPDMKKKYDAIMARLKT